MHNCWIDKLGRVETVEKTRHAVEYAWRGKRRGYCIRVSMPERRRTVVGLEVLGNATPAAARAAAKIVRDLRAEGLDIVADIQGRVIECYRTQRPTALNSALKAI